MLQIKVTEEQRQELSQGARQAVGRESERMHFVLLSDQGHAAPAIGQLLGYEAATVRTWLRRYQTQGISGLADEERSGRPAKEKNLVAIAQAQTGQSPLFFGYLPTCWTIAFLATHLWRRFRVKVSLPTLRRAVHAAGFSWHRPQLAQHRHADPLAEEKLHRLHKALADPNATILAEDESDLHLLATLRAMWQRKGEQVRIPTPGKNATRSLFGACNLRTGQWFYRLSDRKDSLTFIAFLTALLAAYPVGLLYIIVDNASIHASKAVLTWLQANPRCQLVYLPTYSGHRLNPVEKVWWQLKADIAANRSFLSLADLDQAIRRHFAALTPARLLSLIHSDTVERARLPLPQTS
jgi:transposase